MAVFDYCPGLPPLLGLAALAVTPGLGCVPLTVSLLPSLPGTKQNESKDLHQSVPNNFIINRNKTPSWWLQPLPWWL